LLSGNPDGFALAFKASKVLHKEQQIDNLLL
jgi:hypothetical protein